MDNNIFMEDQKPLLSNSICNMMKKAAAISGKRFRFLFIVCWNIQ